ncbi:MAG TPA: winged helix-turn-helix domain-containing protein [Ktedonobacterales bacterium]|nr:winged helix-turn-helix domain-containing protein [Ktedonobacterales bacterium]
MGSPQQQDFASSDRPIAGADFAPYLGSHHTITTYDEHRLLLIDGNPVRFTPLEYRLIRLLLDHAGIPVPFDDLTRAAFQQDADLSTRRALDKHIDRLRSKLRPVGLTLAHVSRYGYVLLGTARG